jgi:ribosome-associated toxin RatA of RatAB toxin-antitoxin module
MLNLLFVLLCICSAADAPFWKSKPKLYDRVQNGEVIVSVTSQNESKDSPHKHLRMSGGGIVAAPCEFVFQEAQKYEEIARLSGYIQNPKYDPATHTLEFSVSAFFYTSTMKSRVDAVAEPKPARLDSTLINGPMNGLHYQLVFADLAAKKCEVGMSGDYNYDQFPIHRIFLQFGMEAVFQNMAQRLRSHVEDSYRATHAKTAGL